MIHSDKKRYNSKYVFSFHYLRLELAKTNQENRRKKIQNKDFETILFNVLLFFAKCAFYYLSLILSALLLCKVYIFFLKRLLELIFPSCQKDMLSR